MTARMPQLVTVESWILSLTIPCFLAGCAASHGGCKTCGKHATVASTASPSVAYGRYTYAMGDGQVAPSTPSKPGEQEFEMYGGQRTCPVTDEALGSMGPPIPASVKGETVYVCCEGCVADVQRDPDSYLVKVAAERGGG